MADMGCEKEQTIRVLVCEKEQTIRMLVEECRKRQSEIRAHLEKNFDRNPKEDVKCEGRPTRPNVLDEIMDGLKDLSNSQKETIDFIVNLISPKL